MRDRVKQIHAAWLRYDCGCDTKSRERIQQAIHRIAEFGFETPVVISEYGDVLVGKYRVEAAVLLGMDCVPCLLEADFRELLRLRKRGAE